MQKIYLTKGHVAYCDDITFPYLNQWLWYSNGEYAKRKVTLSNGTREDVTMHNVVAEYHNLIFPNGVDHIDTNGFNNQISNLRDATQQQQNWNRNKQSSNTSGYIGVAWKIERKKWFAQIRNSSNKREHLGYFDDPIQAAITYDRMCILYRGKLAITNFPHSNYPDLAIYVK